jgi:hypothetical protein
MSTHSINETSVPAQEPSSQSRGSAIRGVWTGLIPLALFVFFVAIALVTTAFARQLVVDSGFAVQGQVALINLVAGLILAIAVFGVAVWRVLRRVALWQQIGESVQAKATLWTLAATAMIIVVPILLAVLLPQSPAP